MSAEEIEQLIGQLEEAVLENRRTVEQIDRAMRQRPYFPDRRKQPRSAA